MVGASRRTLRFRPERGSSETAMEITPARSLISRVHMFARAMKRKGGTTKARDLAIWQRTPSTTWNAPELLSHIFECTRTAQPHGPATPAHTETRHDVKVPNPRTLQTHNSWTAMPQTKLNSTALKTTHEGAASDRLPMVFHSEIN